MSNINNKDYEAALKIVADREYTLLVESKEILVEYLKFSDSTVQKIEEIRGELPTQAFGLSNVRSTVDSLNNQIRSFRDQASYLNNSIDSLLKERNDSSKV